MSGSWWLVPVVGESPRSRRQWAPGDLHAPPPMKLQRGKAARGNFGVGGICGAVLRGPANDAGLIYEEAATSSLAIADGARGGHVGRGDEASVGRLSGRDGFIKENVAVALIVVIHARAIVVAVRVFACEGAGHGAGEESLMRG